MLITAKPTITVNKEGNVTVFHFDIETLGGGNIESVASEFDSLISEQRPRRIVIDLGSIHLIDDLGLALIQSLHDGIEEYGGTAILCHLSPNVDRALREAGLRHRLHIRRTRCEAIWTF